MIRRSIYLLGMGGFGPELLQLLRYTQGEVNWEYGGYFDDNAAEKSGISGPIPGKHCRGAPITRRDGPGPFTLFASNQRGHFGFVDPIVAPV
jgi:hypothetical protein